MPTYTVTVPEALLSQDQKRLIAREITRIHYEVTGAPGYFAQVIFTEVRTGSYFVGGAPLDTDQIFVHGQIRAGRTDQDKHQLIVRLNAGVAAAAELPESHAWTYLVDIAPSQMIEFGKILPLPGEEQAWIASFPEDERRRIESLGQHANR
jgi:phenylpyruvate tautomerase PptA (4-oxalocrotonate tautomerase family)